MEKTDESLAVTVGMGIHIKDLSLEDIVAFSKVSL